MNRATAIAPHPVSRDLYRSLELVGLAMDMAALSRDKYSLLIPVGLRLVGDDGGEWVSGAAVVAWDRLEQRHMTPADTRRCLWDFIDLAGVSGDGFPEAVVGFVQQWGVLDFGENGRYMEMDRKSWRELQEWRDNVYRVRTLLVTFAATEAGELVHEEILEQFSDVDRIPWTELEVPASFRGTRKEDADGTIHFVGQQGLVETMRRLEEETRWRKWREERRAGRGLALQRRLVVERLLHWGTLELFPTWSEDGRSIDAVATGVSEIVGAHLRNIFTSTQLDVYICSVCGNPYPFEEDERYRRPRAGVSRFCSESCRGEGKRRANLASWHKNKEKWTRRRP